MEFKCGTCEEENQPAIKAYYFKMIKKGGGWKTVGFFTRDDDTTPPTLVCNDDDEVPSRYSTLSKIKKSFEETSPLTYVIDGHLTAPSEIYQVVVKFRHSSDRKERKELWKGTKKTLCYDVYYDYHYVDDIPKNILVRWMNF